MATKADESRKYQVVHISNEQLKKITTKRRHQMEDAVSTLIRVVRVPLAVLSVIQNLLIVIVVLRYPTLKKNVSNLLIAQLGFADFIFGVGLCIRIAITEVHISTGMFTFESFECLCYGSVTILGVHLSQTTMLMIAVDRLFCIRFPHHYRTMQKSGFSWIRVCISVIYSLVGTGAQFIHTEAGRSVYSCSAGASWNVYYRIYWVLFAAVLSFFICGLYLISIPPLRRSSADSFIRCHRSAVITMTTIIISYCIFWCLPNFTYFLCVLFNAEHSILGGAIYFMSLGSGLFAVLNLYLYIWKHREFRYCFLNMFTCGPIRRSAADCSGVGVFKPIHPVSV
ncbi:Beta-2 adrenergic receptor [Toxocara canis]|uniref:Beta-2 adrenergic receptor n=1 Tax=Toxocara canis TaxID=6265 RepID=A0A0B2VGW5_TOXCA|nr:Beta-2 adrenergic receptor [Toxocara canis]